MVLLSDLRPKYDVQMGSFPPDREMSVEQLLRPIILKKSDQHSGLDNAHVAQLYEMQENVIPKIALNNGDYTDLQALERPDTFLNIEALCFHDQTNWLQAKYGIQEANTDGNHDQKFIAAIEEARKAGMNIFPAIRIQHPHQRDVVQLHGHHFDSPTMVVLPMRMAAGIYDDMVSRGADGAEAAKIAMKILLDGLGYEDAYRNASHKYDANLDLGHVHLLKLMKLNYGKEFSTETLKRDFKNFAKNSLLNVVSWLHKTGKLESFVRNVLIPAFSEITAEGKEDSAKKGIETLLTRTAQLLLPNKLKNAKYVPAAEKTFTPAFMKVIEPFFHRIEEAFIRTARQILPVLEADPSIPLFKDLTVERLRPLNREKTPIQTESGAKTAEVNVYGCWIDNRSTYGATYADGVTYAMDWMKVREAVKTKLGLPDEIPSGNDLVLKHFKAYGGFHPKTLEKFKLFIDLKGVLPDEETRERSKLPKLDQMATVQISRTGEIEIITPDGRPLVKAEIPKDHEIVRPADIIQKLREIDTRTSNDLEARMASNPTLKHLFMPQNQLIHSPKPTQFIPGYVWPLRPELSQNLSHFGSPEAA